jgi:hypothetical protein
VTCKGKEHGYYNLCPWVIGGAAAVKLERAIMSVEKSKCKGVVNGYGCCPWPITGGTSMPFYDLQERLEKEGADERVVKTLRLEMVEFMILMDKLVFTTSFEKAKEILPGLEIWLKDIRDNWTPEDCYCGDGVQAPKLNDAELERIKILWTKSRLVG